LGRPSGHASVQAHGFVPHLWRIGEEKFDPATSELRFPAWRCVEERTLAWLSKCRALLVRYDRTTERAQLPENARNFLRTRATSWRGSRWPVRSSGIAVCIAYPC